MKILPTRRSFAVLSFASIAAIGMAGCAMQQPMPAASNIVKLTTQLRGTNEVPPNTSPGAGMVEATFNKDTRVLSWRVTYSGLTAPASAGHFHGPAAASANAGVVMPWPSAANGATGSAVVAPAQVGDLLAGFWYANVHTATFPGGEIRGQMVLSK
ncbi:CHRD domain-containing protein [Polaromonas sp.]|uniref:CHRD domain-containing protein n=1 Tax=Polaromonas sp. TaxID=1869339 RepID=UPI0024887940|nr:CHRD domain-containing protein [Polaromonas sp.]MDI1272414.1 CHRD domain-containing protein [Polaromonas sp.]